MGHTKSRRYLFEVMKTTGVNNNIKKTNMIYECAKLMLQIFNISRIVQIHFPYNLMRTSFKDVEGVRDTFYIIPIINNLIYRRIMFNKENLTYLVLLYV